MGGAVWKSRDPRAMMDADRKIYFVNKRRRAAGLNALEDCESLEMRRFAAGVLSTLRLADLREAEVSVGKLCRLVERAVPGLKWFAEEMGAVCEPEEGEALATEYEKRKRLGAGGNFWTRSCGP